MMKVEKKPAFISIRTKLLILFCVLIFLPLIALSTLSYNISTRAMTNQAVKSTATLLDANVANIESVIREVESTSSYAIVNKDIRSYLTMTSVDSDPKLASALIDNIKGFIEFILISKGYIHSVEFRGVDDRQIAYGSRFIGNEGEWIDQAVQERGKITWTGRYENGDIHHEPIISLVRVINDYNAIDKALGIVIIRLKVSKVNELIQSKDSGAIAGTMLLDHDGNSITEQRSEPGDKFQLDSSSIHQLVSSEGKPVDEKDNLLLYKKIAYTGWGLISWVDKDHLFKESRSIQFYTILIVAISVATVLYASWLIFNWILKPIERLTKMMKKVDDNYFRKITGIRSKDEIGLLAANFNAMMDRIHDLIDKEYKLTLKQKEIELHVLQMQINPHFLYNTLDMIRWKARIEKAMETSRLIQVLSTLFRLSLHRSGTWVELKDEALYVRSYLDLQQQRLGARLTCEIDIEDELLASYVPKMILQPLVENSIVHGMPGQQKPMHITVRSTRLSAGDAYHIDIIDDGLGADIQALSDLIAYTGEGSHGMRNVYLRLSLWFGDRFRMEFLPAAAGTHIRLTIPFVDTIPAESSP
ncbi:sensor histidine kinase [Paenibacillus sp. NPDC058174]|uniref:cache domain-containing sensor histidine kinase n=1 Tax=Paenibacillus sp. NPDC058174 TaxID=3346366 RepID=UPI0036DF74C8